MGRTAFIDKLETPFVMLTPQVTYYRVKDHGVLSARYLKHYFDSPEFQQLFDSWGHKGSTRSYLGITSQLDLPVVFPAIREQRAIAHILGTLDDKIEVNRRMNETLEAMARALFKSWFLDGERAGNWSTQALLDCVDVARGLSYKGDGLTDTGVPMHNLNSIYEGGGYKHDGIKHYNGEFKSQHLVRAGDLIVANTEQGHDRLLIGYAAIVPERFAEPSLFSHHLYRVRPKTDCHLTAEYLCHLLNSRTMHDTVSGYANGTTVNMLSMDGLQLPEFAIPPKDLVDRFTAFARSVRLRQEAMIEENRTLAATRDTLLPKLISGEIRVPEALKQSEEPVQ